MAMKEIAIANANYVTADKILTSDDGSLYFLSTVCPSNVAKEIEKELNTLEILNINVKGWSRRQTLKGRYNVMMKRYQNTEYVHLIAYATDYYEETDHGEEFTALILKRPCDDLNDLVYEKLSEYSSVPILKEWMPKINEIFANARRLKRLPDLTGEAKDDNPLDGYMLRGTKQSVATTVTSLLKGGDISIGGNNNDSEILNAVNGLDSYLAVYSDTLAEKIQSSFKPKFDASQEDYTFYVDKVDDYIYHNAGINLYEAQKTVIQSVVNNLNTNKNTFLCGEMGSGKTILGATIPYAHNAKRYKGFNSIVMCPSHLVSKWSREIERAIPNSKTYIINDFKDLIELEPVLRKENKIENSYVIVSKDKSKIGYDLKPAVLWSKVKKTFVCPDCGQPLFTSHYDKRTKEYKQIFFNEMSMLKEYANNKICMNFKNVYDTKRNMHRKVPCDAKLWEPLNRDDQNSKWIKLGSEGWIMKEHIISETERMQERLEKASTPIENESEYEKEKREKAGILTTSERKMFERLMEQYVKVISGEEASTIYKGPKKYPVSKYIRERMNQVFDYAIMDECHLYKGDTEQGQAAGDIIKASKKSILLTGTLLNGYADGLFYLLYRTNPRLMKAEGFRYKDESKFARVYGVTSSEQKYKATNGRKDKKQGSVKSKRLPGVSPLVFTKFLLNNAVFLSLSDMAEGLPNYEEIPIPVVMDSDLRAQYDAIYRSFRDNVKVNTGMKFAGSYLHLMGNYPDAPHCMKPILNLETSEVMYTPTVLPWQERAKERALMDKVVEKIDAGEKVLIYYSSVHTTDIGDKVVNMLKSRQINAFELKSSIAANKREEYINDKVDKGAQVMICNPSLVETGLDLLDFTTIIFYQIGYNLFTMRQASRRSWRLSQEKDVQVYFMYYKDTIQEQTLSLMATKLHAAMAIEGKFSEEGLRAMSENQDMLTQIANNIVEGIKDTVDESMFKPVVKSETMVATERDHTIPYEDIYIPMTTDGYRATVLTKYIEAEKVITTEEELDIDYLELFC